MKKKVKFINFFFTCDNLQQKIKIFAFYLYRSEVQSIGNIAVKFHQNQTKMV